MAAKLTAGPTPDGTFISRRTDNDYSFAIAIRDTNPRRYAPKSPRSDEYGYIPNPTLGQWVSLSWHSRYDLAAAKLQALNNRGIFDVVIVPVV